MYKNEPRNSNGLRVSESTKYNITGVMLLGVEGKQQRLTDEIMKYKELLDDGIITEEEFSIKEGELLRKLIK